MMGGKFGVTMAKHLVDCARHFAAFDMGGPDVICGGNKGAGQCFDPVTMHDDQIGLMFGHKDPGTGENVYPELEMVRLAVGLENIDDILADIDQGLQKAAG